MDHERFIIEVQHHAVLYDSSHAFYKDHTRTERAWNDIAATVGSTANDCKSRWKQLRDSFVKYRKRTSLPSGAAGGSQRDWKYAELMSFLIPFLQSRSSKINLGPMPTSGSVEGVEAGEDEKLETPSSQESCAPSPIPHLSMVPTSEDMERVFESGSPGERAQPPGQETKRRNTQVSDLEDRLMGVQPNTEQDEAYHFALSTVPLLLNLNKTRRRQAKREIMRVLDLLNEEEEGEQVAAFHVKAECTYPL
uniref:MADF domain-containing protein n=1 Tax=Nothobranchius korthausae TaxID=1143690 RepID=A0A1A8EN57_9TELE